MGKNIVFCADGTWNSPHTDDDADGVADQTNVYKLFTCLEGKNAQDSLLDADEQEKALPIGNFSKQIAKYIHGVGDSRNPINKLLGGGFGAGVIKRIVRGYTFISRNYQLGDSIYIVGFSRGAYTARALAGLIATQGVLDNQFMQNKVHAYRLGAAAWYAYRKEALSRARGWDAWWARFAELIADLPAFLSEPLTSEHFIQVNGITAVAVWDTVGAMGIPDFEDGKPVDAFKFVDTELSRKVKNGFHAVAIDEERLLFTPTLWNPADNVLQMLFPGAHADVGGGYPIKNNESGLSDGALKWMIEELKSVGVEFTQNCLANIKPNPAGVAHKPWMHKPWTDLPTAKRIFPPDMLPHESYAARKAAGNVVAEPGETPAPY